ncbi:hypothetical protein ACWGI8_44335 [Streptomyces sp. NPDC054841]
MTDQSACFFERQDRALQTSVFTVLAQGRRDTSDTAAAQTRQHCGGDP